MQENIAKITRFRWCNVFDGMCKMGRELFRSWFDVN